MAEWVAEFETLSYEDTYAGYESPTERRIFNWKQQYSRGSLNWEESMDLKVSLELLLRMATFLADMWKDVNTRFDDKRSFPTFLWLLQTSDLDWHKYIELNLDNQLNTWSLQAPSYLSLASDSNWVMANKYYDKSLSLMQLLQRIHSESGNDYSREQAGLLASFLDHLLKMQQEQRVLAYCFSEHLEQLRKSVATSLLAFSTNGVDGDGDWDKGPFIFFNYSWDYYMRQQKHMFDSLYIMSRESTWLLRKLEASHSISPSLAEESHKILEIITLFISKFKKCKESLDQSLDGCLPFDTHRMMRMALENIGILDEFERRIKDLQEQGIGRKSVSETLPGDSREYVTGMLLECFRNVVSKAKIAIDEPGAEWRNFSGDILDAYSNAAEETLELINEAIEKLNSVMFSSLTGGGTPLGNITYWRILFESSLVNHRLDRICKNYRETIKLGVKLLDSTDKNIYHTVPLHVETYLNRLHGSISLLLSAGDRILLEFVAMHKTLSEITYMLGDAFTTGGAGMNDMSDETSPGTSIQNEKGDFDFPWDKHNVPDKVKYDPNDPSTQIVYANSSFVYDPDSDSGSDTEFS
ncbi:hypothetical protein MKX03_011231 [Papaver bracteatum]|nr:hypothetical protein MKX03_011231 [Papaver bracteatum]